MMSYAQPRQDSVLQGQDVPDGVLVGQAQAGDQRAFELLVSRYHCPLVSYIRVFLKDSEEVYDVLQHVFFHLYVSLPILFTHVSLKAWLFQVARNRCLDELRRRRRRAEVPFSTFERKFGEELALFAAAGHVFSASDVSFDRPPALFQATELLGGRAHAQNAGGDRKGFLLPLAAALAQSAREQRALYSRLVVCTL